MSLFLKVRPAAAADIEDAYTWYETRRPGLGEEFLQDGEALRLFENALERSP